MIFLILEFFSEKWYSWCPIAHSKLIPLIGEQVEKETDEFPRKNMINGERLKKLIQKQYSIIFNCSEEDFSEVFLSYCSLFQPL